VLTGPFDFVVDAIDRMTPKALLIGGCHERGWPVITVGAAGGRRDPTQIRTGDLGEVSNDELLRQVRKKLRRAHGFATARSAAECTLASAAYGRKRNRFLRGPMAPARPSPSPARTQARLRERARTAVFVTGAFGLVAAGEVVRTIADKD